MNLFAGFKYSLREDWRSRVAPPVKPGNWKEDTWKEKQEEAWLKKADSDNLLSGRVSSVVLYSAMSGIKHEVDSLEFVSRLINAVPLTVFGFGIFDGLRMCLWDAVAAGKPTHPWLWSSFEDRRHLDEEDKVFLVDPYMLCGAKGAELPYAKWLELWGVTGAEAECPAVAASVVARKMGFV